ncbi:hypothetical protein SAMN04487764_1832 [Gillisia sp. Hel1_33_143]|uniref:hypothetical protein n=1 Tax=unclassified Gillisia TaxID=2615025 RepID=UPI0005515E45|nr:MULTISPECIES: hypothetical protein [unclassified Gillisia]SDS27054.1 hypothetical protein SAMN04487764_1832 [Gillisia sp. Hel1_33_143]
MINYLIEICIAIDIAILGIAYPILIDKISNIGSKYYSEYLTNIFDAEFPNNKVYRGFSFFQIILIITLLSFIFQIFWIPTIPYFTGNIIIDNSADLIVFFLTLILTGTFLYWLNRIMLFQGKASELLKYLISEYNNQQQDNQHKTYLLKSINEFAIYAIKHQDFHLQESLVNFYSSLFYRYRENFDPEEGPIYPIDLYFVNNEIIATSIHNENLKLKVLEHRASSGIWLIGENFKFSKLSNETYRWLWRNLVISSNHKKLISNYWSRASQNFNYSLSALIPEYENGEIANQKEIDKVNIERKQFLEFNYALGGLLFYQKEYHALQYILSFSQSQPPSYPLLPQTMDEIFSWFEHFSNEFRTMDEPLEFKYSFPEIDNLGISNDISNNICLYISLLFIRQFTQQKIYVYQNFRIFHNLTDDLQTLYSYNDRLPYFRSCIEQVLGNKELLKDLDFKIKSEEEILETFDNLDQKIKEKIDLTKLGAGLSQEKITTFYDSTKEIITSAFKKYNVIGNEENFKDVDDSMVSSINGELIVSTKSSFTDNDIPNINFDTIYAESIARYKIQKFLPNAFLVAKTNRFVLERNQLIEGLDRLLKKLDNKIIVAIRPSYESKQLIDNSKYKKIFIEIPSSNHHLNDNFFILDKKDLPKFESKDLSKTEIEKFNLNLLNEEYKIYSNVIDINLPKNEDLKEEYLTSDDEELKVLIVISFIFLIKWRKERKIIMLALTSPFNERGIVDNIEDVIPL